MTSSDIWTTAYAAALADPGDTLAFMPQPQAFRGQTIRQAVRLRRGGNRLRLVLSNEFGHTPLVIDEVTLSSARQKPARPVLHHGSARWEIPPGELAASDPVSLPIAAGDEVAVSCYAAGTAGPGGVLALRPEDRPHRARQPEQPRQGRRPWRLGNPFHPSTGSHGC